jgi:hypothetical protein
MHDLGTDSMRPADFLKVGKGLKRRWAHVGRFIRRWMLIGPYRSDEAANQQRIDATRLKHLDLDTASS